MAPLSFAKEVAFLFCQFYGCDMETPRSQERASGSNGAGSAGAIESSIWQESILPGAAVMMHQETTVPGGLIVCCKEAGTSLLHGD